MTTFTPLQLQAGDMPFLHVGEVRAVSFSGPEMAIRILTKSPAQDVTAKIYYHPAVPYDPETETYPCQLVSARYLMVGEKVSVFKNGTDYWVVSSLMPASNPYTNLVSNKYYTGREIANAQWVDLLDNHSAGPILFIKDDARRFLLNNLTVTELEEPMPPWDDGVKANDYINLKLYWPNFHLPQVTLTSGILNQSYPVHVGITPSIANLTNWTWRRGSCNGIWTGWDFTRKPSVLFPTPQPSIRLELQPSEPEPPTSDYEDYLPDLVFYVAPSDIGYGMYSNTRDFIEIDTYFKELFSIARPWGTVASNPDEVRTGNWVPNILFCPEDAGASFKLHFGFIDYEKESYVDDDYDQWYVGNIYHVVDGVVTVTVKEGSEGKTILGVPDFDITHSYITTEYNSEYILEVNNTGTDNTVTPGNFNEWVQTSSMNQIGQDTQDFLVCTDGQNPFTKRPKITYRDFIRADYTSGDPVMSANQELSIEIEHRILGISMFTSTFNVFLDGEALSIIDPGSETWNQRYYFIYHVDLINRLLVCDIYIKDYALSIQRIERVVIDNGVEYLIWSYTPFAQQDGAATNIPPWDDSLIDFPSHPYSTGFTGDETVEHTEKQWKGSFLNGLLFPVSALGQPGCYNHNSSDGVFYPVTPLDEDIHSVPLMINTGAWNLTGLPGDMMYQHARDTAWVQKRPEGWLAFGRCCHDPDSGVIDYFYGSDIIKKDNGVVSGAPELYNTPDDIWKTYY